jgi:hypothetical protein
MTRAEVYDIENKTAQKENVNLTKSSFSQNQLFDQLLPKVIRKNNRKKAHP